jgi:hypothetical protein
MPISISRGISLNSSGSYSAFEEIILTNSDQESLIAYTDATALSTALSQASLVVPAGTIIASSLHTNPTGFLLCDGSNTASRTTYSALFNAIVPNKGTVTFTIASPCVSTLNSHNLLTGESVFFTTTGNLPTGLSVDTLYFLRIIDTNTFHLYDTYVNATTTNSTTGRINTSVSQSGVHSLFFCPYGLGSTTSNFKLPDLRNATMRGRGLSTAFTQNDTTRLGFLENDAMQGHNHGSVSSRVGGSLFLAPGNGYEWTNGSEAVGSPTNDGTNGTPRTANETKMKNQGVNFFIKF